MTKRNMIADEENYVFGIEGFRDRVSSLLLEQFRELLTEGKINLPSISDEMKFLEGLTDHTATKRQSKFNRGKLKGFWHKHYFNGDLAEQAFNYSKIFKKPDVIERIILRSTESHEDPKSLSADISKKIVSDQFANISRSQAWTGNWLIYKPYKGKIFYLMVAPHTAECESSDYLFEIIYSCCHREFPLSPPQ